MARYLYYIYTAKGFERMKLAMPIWNDCISTVLDFSDCLLVVDYESGVIHNRSMVSFAGATTVGKVARLKELGIQVLLCGAVSISMERMITALGIETIPFIRGGVNDVLNAYFAGRLVWAGLHVTRLFAQTGLWKGYGTEEARPGPPRLEY